MARAKSTNHALRSFGWKGQGRGNGKGREMRFIRLKRSWATGSPTLGCVFRTKGTEKAKRPRFQMENTTLPFVRSPLLASRARLTGDYIRIPLDIKGLRRRRHRTNHNDGPIRHKNISPFVLKTHLCHSQTHWRYWQRQETCCQQQLTENYASAG